MDQRRVGDRTVGAIGLGAMPMSVREHNDEQLAVRTIHAALDAGVTLIDTADAYAVDEDSFGHNERLVAKALASSGRADDVLVATKGGHTRRGTEWHLDGRPEYLRQAVEGSLRRLGVEAIGLYQHHRPDPKVDYAETMGGLKQLLDDGLIVRAGISNADPGQIRLAREILGEGLVSVQNELSPKFRSSEPELELCTELGIAFLPWSPLGGMSQAAELGDRFAPFAEVGVRHGVSAQQVALAWELAKSPVVIPIPGASRVESVLDSVAAADLVLDDEDLARLDAPRVELPGRRRGWSGELGGRRTHGLDHRLLALGVVVVLPDQAHLQHGDPVADPGDALCVEVAVVGAAALRWAVAEEVPPGLPALDVDRLEPAHVVALVVGQPFLAGAPPGLEHLERTSGGALVGELRDQVAGCVTLGGGRRLELAHEGPHRAE